MADEKTPEAPAAEANPAEANTPEITPAKPPAPQEIPASKTPRCPYCAEKLEVYAGDAAHKLGTAFCHACGLRHRLKG